MTTAETVDLTHAQLRRHVGETHGWYCSICGGNKGLVMSTINKRQPDSPANCMLTCGQCADFRDHGIRPDTETRR